MAKQRLVREELADGQVYEYIPLGKHVVSAPGVCRGRPTFKYTRIEVAGVLSSLCAGNPVEELIEGYRGRVTAAALQEAGALAAKALLQQASAQGSGLVRMEPLGGMLRSPFAPFRTYNGFTVHSRMH
jgi:uncharacterized protein (DUF433 family)